MKDKFIYLIFIIWLASCVCYFGHVALNNNIVSKIALGISYIIDLYYFIYTMINVKKYSIHTRKLIGVIGFILILIVFYSLFAPNKYYSNELRDYIGTFGSVKLIFFSLSSFFPAINFALKGYFTSRILSYTSIIVFIVGLLNYRTFLAYLQDINGESALNVNNMAYYLTCSMLFIPFCRNKILRYVMALVCVYFCIVSAKRGAILLSLVMLLFMFYYWYKEIKVKHKYASLLFIGIIIIISIYGLSEAFQTDVIQRRLERSGIESQVRESFWKTLIENYTSSSIFVLLFGNGFLSTIPVVGNFAHNDWLEILYDFGLLGFGLYFILYFEIFKLLIITLKRNITPVYKLLLILILSNILLRSAFSMVIDSVPSVIPFILLGILIVIIENCEKNTFIC